MIWLPFVVSLGMTVGFWLFARRRRSQLRCGGDLQREIWEREYSLGFRDDPPPEPPIFTPVFGLGELAQIEEDFSRVTGIDMVGAWAAVPGPVPAAGRVVWQRGDEVALDCGHGRAAFADVSELRPLN